MLFVRIHLDESTAENGAMQIALGSHLAGAIPADRADAQAARCTIETTTAAPGDVLVLSMLTLHRSAVARSDAPRRVLRVDYATKELPLPLQWAA